MSTKQTAACPACKAPRTSVGGGDYLECRACQDTYDQGWGCHRCEETGVLKIPESHKEWSTRVACLACGALHRYVPVFWDDSGYQMDCEWEPA